MTEPRLARRDDPVITASSEPAGRPVRLRIALDRAAAVVGSTKPGPCPRCGSRGFNRHQRSFKRIKDPVLRQTEVVRYLCKACGYVQRSYPTGIGRHRQTPTLKRLSVLLYRVGLPFQLVTEILDDLGCRISATTVRQNVIAAQGQSHPFPRRDRLRLARVGRGELSGPDGSLSLRLEAPAAGPCWLEVEIAPGRQALEIRWRLEAGARRLGLEPSPADA